MESDRWEIFRCYSCRAVIGELKENIPQSNQEESNNEMAASIQMLVDEEIALAVQRNTAFGTGRK